MIFDDFMMFIGYYIPIFIIILLRFIFILTLIFKTIILIIQSNIIFQYRIKTTKIIYLISYKTFI